MTGAYVIMTEDCKRVENWVGHKRCKSNNITVSLHSKGIGRRTLWCKLYGVSVQLNNSTIYSLVFVWSLINLIYPNTGVRKLVLSQNPNILILLRFTVELIEFIYSTLLFLTAKPHWVQSCLLLLSVIFLSLAQVATCYKSKVWTDF